MVDYYGNRHDERFIYKRVSFPAQVEGEELQQICGGSLESSAFSDIRESGTLDFIGHSKPDDHDLVRIYYTFLDDDDQRATHALATMRMSNSEPVYNGDMVSGSIKLSGLLQVLANKKYGRPFTVRRNTKAVAFAKQLCEGLGLRVNATASSYTTAADHTFKSEDSYLTICNWLMEVAGYAGLDTDAYGVVQMHPYIEPTDRACAWTFRDGENCVFFPDVQVSNNWADTPNVVRLSHETDTVGLWAAAYNIDATSRASIVQRCEECTLYESVSELDGSNATQKLSALKSKANRKLIDNSGTIEYTTLEHAWVPVSRNTSVALEYADAGLAKNGSISNQSISLMPSCPTKSKVRRFVHASLVTRIEGGILWQ
ncbi:MAG: hypothetical protein Q4C41_03460 [Eggerthellaceae bacterium]|nr:hypothetical protein [Eggerthellaceae bacterium]